MPRFSVPALCVTAILGAAPLAAQAPASRAAGPAIPTTQAGDMLRQWLDAFNSGDSTRLDTFYKRYQPEMKAEYELPFRRRTGGFELLSIEKSEPRHIEFTLKERNSPMVGYGAIDVSPAPAAGTPAGVTNTVSIAGTS